MKFVELAISWVFAIMRRVDRFQIMLFFGFILVGK